MAHNRMASKRRQCTTSSRLVHVSLDRIASTAELARSLNWVRRRSGDTPGIDGIKLDQSSRPINASAWLKDLSDRIASGSYRPKPVLECRIPKLGRPGQFRRIGIPTIEDRIVARTFSRLLQPGFEPSFDDCSFGYRLSRGTQTCVLALVARLNALLASGHSISVIKTDVAKLFDSLDHPQILDLLQETVADPGVRRLIRRFMRAGRVIDGKTLATRIGLAQGLSLSSLIANLYLDTLDRWYAERRTFLPGSTQTDPERRDRLFLFRYVDDLLIVVDGSVQDAQAELQLLKEFMSNHLHLHLADGDKTWIRDAGEPFDFLGFGVCPLTKSQVQMRIPPYAIRALLDKIEQILRRGRSLHWPKGLITARILNSLSSWSAYYSIASNLSETLAEARIAVRTLYGRNKRWLNASVLRALSDKCAQGRQGGQTGRVSPDTSATPNPALPPSGCEVSAAGRTAGTLASIPPAGGA